jgi:hypothetical protein
MNLMGNKYKAHNTKVGGADGKHQQNSVNPSVGSPPLNYA